MNEKDFAPESGGNKEVGSSQTAPDVEIVGVRFKDGGKIYYFDPAKKTLEAGSSVIIETARGLEFGFVVEENHKVPSKDIVQPLRRVVRVATEADKAQYERNRELEASAMELCRRKISEHGLDMKLIEAEYTFDNSKLMFYFTAESRVDFRDLVKDLASVFKTRIELRQIGIRDEAKMIGGIGICGRPFCCASFMTDFVQVSIKMAKEQNLSLNSAKISGACGRLMCCLRYEHETYEREAAITPKVGSKVQTPDGVGTVAEANLLTGNCKVKFSDGKSESVKVYHRDKLKNVKVKEEK